MLIFWTLSGTAILKSCHGTITASYSKPFDLWMVKTETEFKPSGKGAFSSSPFSSHHDRKAFISTMPFSSAKYASSFRRSKYKEASGFLSSTAMRSYSSHNVSYAVKRLAPSTSTWKYVCHKRGYFSLKALKQAPLRSAIKKFHTSSAGQAE